MLTTTWRPFLKKYETYNIHIYNTMYNVCMFHSVVTINYIIYNNNNNNSLELIG